MATAANSAVAIMLLLLATALVATEGGTRGELGLGRVGAPTASADGVSGRVRTHSLVDCLIGCVSLTVDCGTFCSNKPPGEQANCTALCVAQDVSCVTGCSPALGPAPPADA